MELMAKLQINKKLFVYTEQTTTLYEIATSRDNNNDNIHNSKKSFVDAMVRGLRL